MKLHESYIIITYLEEGTGFNRRWPKGEFNFMF